MDFNLSRVSEMMAKSARDFCVREVPRIDEYMSEQNDYPPDLMEIYAKARMLGLVIPKEYGGVESTNLNFILLCEELGKTGSTCFLPFMMNNSVAETINFVGSEDVKKRILPTLCNGTAWATTAFTEPGTGSDPKALTTTAELDGDAYILNGRKSWVSGGPVADYVVVFMVTDPDAGHRGITCFLIDATLPGFIRAKKEPKMGIRASATSELVFEDYRCPVEHRLGEEGEGFKIAMTVLDAGRIGVASQALGIAEAAYEASVEYAKEREAFGKKIGQFQGINFKIADMKTRIEASRLLIHQAAYAKERFKTTGERFTLEASMAKLFASETATFCADAAVQIHAGMGYSKELPIERYYRDAKITEIYEGTSEIQRMVIARLETGLR